MTTFALVHGAWHGAWCWDRLTPLLEQDGHRVVAVDLPCDDPSATFEDYAQVVVDALADVEDEPVLVGHSLAGITVPIVAARRPVRRIVYLCALLPRPGVTLADLLRGNPETLSDAYRAGLAPADGAGSTRWVDEALAHELLFGDCDDETARDAFTKLRPQGIAGYLQPWPLDALPDVPATYVVCAEDRLVNPDWSRRAATEIGAEVVELPGSHSPFLSRPRELADLLVTV